MIEISLTEMFLFAWAIIATGYALKHKADKDGTMEILRRVIEDKEARDDIVGKYEEWKKRAGREA